MQSTEYPFRLERSPKKKGTCPECQTKGSFRFYEDLEGKRLEEFGICDRQNNCGAHLAPKGIKHSGKVREPQPQPVLIYPDAGQLATLEKVRKTFDTPLHIFLAAKLGIPAEHFDKWGLGGNRDKTVFIFRNREGRIVNAKTMLYKEDGHRNKEFVAVSFKQPDDELKRYSMCLYGEHLLEPLKPENNRLVILVESEKSSVIASFFYPQFDWLSCASNTGLTDAKIPPLFGRQVVWLCDADKAGRPGKYNSSIRKLQAYQVNFHVVDLFPDRTDGYDIADYIIDNKDDLMDLALVMPSYFVDPDPALYPVEEKPEKVKNTPEAATIEKELLTKKIVESKELTNKEKEKKKSVITEEEYSNTVWYVNQGMRIKSGKNFEEVAPNFQVYIKYRTEDEQENVSWILEIRKAIGDPVYIEVLHDEFCSARKLKSMLAAKRLGFKIKEGHLDELHSYLFTRTEFNTAIKVVRYGYHVDSEVFFFSNKAFNVKTGEMLTPDDFKIIQANQLHLSMPKLPKDKQARHTLTEQSVPFKKFWELYATAHGRENTFVPICFYIFSLFRDIGIKYKNFSPILYLKGGAGTGKSSMIRVLTAAFGKKQEGVNLKGKNTDSSLVKLMSQSSNAIIWFDEFHNEMPNEGLLQAAYDNDGYHKSTTDFNSIETASVEIHSALGLTSNYIPANPIFFSRCLFVPITDADKTDTQREAYEALKDMEENGLGCLTVELLKYRALLLADDNYNIRYNQLYNGFRARFKGQKIPERLFANMSQIMAAPLTLQIRDKINLLDFETDNPTEILKEYIDLGVNFIMRQFRIQNDSKAAAEFFEIIQQLFDSHQINEEIHFRFSGDNILLNFRKLYNLFAQKYRQINYKSPPDRDTIQSELATLAGKNDWEAISKGIRFINDGTSNSKASTIPQNGSCELNYKQLQHNYGIDFLNRTGGNM